MLLGNYFSVIDSSLLTLQRGDDRLFQNEMANKINVRALGSSEFAQNTSLNSALLKSITGGDQLTARYMHAKHITNFTPKFKVFLFGNFLPRITDATEGIWRRALYVPMNVDIATKTKPREMVEVLAEFKKELEPFSIHLMHYYKEFLKNGLIIPKAIADFIADEKIENNVLYDFLTANFEEGTEQIPTDEIYRAYKEYCDLQGEKPTFFNSRSLTSALKERGLTISPGGKNKRYLLGMKRLYDVTLNRPNISNNQF
jgi:putative DNA primase/helicase